MQAAVLYRAFSDDMWEISISGQMSACIYSAVFGALLCILYDIIRATRKAGADSFLAVFIGDVLFWLISAVAVFIFLVAVTNGELRGYVLFFCLIGFVIYRFTVGRLTFFFMCKMFSFLAFCIQKLSYALANFGLVIDGWTHRMFSNTFGVLSRFFSRIKKLLKSIYNMLYTKRHKSKTEFDVNE